MHQTIRADRQSYLDVKDVKVGGKTQQWTLASSRFEPYGSPLSIKLADGVKKGQEVELDVRLQH